jgi:hypothetical protein
MSARRQITLPEDLCASAEQRFAARFQGLEPFLEFVLRELVRDDIDKLDRAELDAIDKRLRDLGYL